ncbi:hypothetical protein CDAR_218291 [Caerostris darwini]|uniref:Uncharacterized protein n=1 Tax=Caerostris darwini TaxID=1538125 RepID=A0AAV4R9H1_9ARAC|nr:hypothetical protein CDAR_218291 [Caerostris darwini]
MYLNFSSSMRAQFQRKGTKFHCIFFSVVFPSQYFRYSSSLDYVHRMVKQRDGDGMCAMLSREEEEKGDILGSNSASSFLEIFSRLVSLLLECMIRNK